MGRLAGNFAFALTELIALLPNCILGVEEIQNGLLKITIIIINS